MQINTQVGDQGRGTGRNHGRLISSTCLPLKSSFSPPLPFRRPPFLLWLSVVAQTIKNPPAMRETWVRSLDQEDPLEESMTTLVSLPGESHGQRSLAGYSPGSRRESDATERPTHIFPTYFTDGHTSQVNTAAQNFGGPARQAVRPPAPTPGARCPPSAQARAAERACAGRRSPPPPRARAQRP